MGFSGFWTNTLGNPIWAGIFLLALGLIFPILARIIFPTVTKAILFDLRLPRVLYFWVLSGLGAALWLSEGERRMQLLEPENWVLALVWGLSLTYAAIFAIVSNNYFDQVADRISNPQRPLIAGRVEAKPYWAAGVACQLIALLLSFGLNTAMGFGIVAISAGYFIYSCPPFRLKRVPILSKGLVGLNSWFAVVTGWAILGAEWKQFPLVWSLFILLPLSLAANFIDLKDTEGDRAAGIATLPVLLGESMARHIIAGATVLTYAWAGWMLHLTFVYPLGLICLITHLYFLYRKPYDEKWVFATLIVALCGLDFFLFFK